MSRPVPSAPSRRAARRRRLATTVAGVCITGFVALPSAAPAAPVAITVNGHDEARSVAPEHQIKTLAMATDPATGDWSTTITFGAAQLASPGPGLRVALQLADSKVSAASWFLRTAPGPLVPQYSNPYPLGTDSVPPTAASFNPERTALTVRVADPRLVGRTVDKISASLFDPDVDGVGYSAAVASLGPRAPQPRIPAAAKRLVVAPDGRLRIPLTPLGTRAERGIDIDLPHHHALADVLVPAVHYRRRAVSVRLLRDQLRHISRTPRTVTLTVRTMLPNGDRARTSVPVSIRRR